MRHFPGAIPRFIAIDDDPVNNMICKLTIETVAQDMDIVTFTDPGQGFDFIREEYIANGNRTPAILLLDLNMPGMSGWEFLERFDQLDAGIKELIHVYILSSSVDHRDRQRSYTNKNVRDFLVKPLVRGDVEQMLAS